MHTTIDILAGTGDPQDWLLEIEQAGSSVISTHLANLWSCDCWIAEVVIRREASNLTVTMADGHPQFTNRDGQVLVEPRTGPDPPGDPPKVEAA